MEWDDTQEGLFSRNRKVYLLFINFRLFSDSPPELTYISFKKLLNTFRLFMFNDSRRYLNHLQQKLKTDKKMLLMWPSNVLFRSSAHSDLR